MNKFQIILKGGNPVANNDTAGIGDPYWYEWSIGLLNVIDMINPDNGINSVALQATSAQGLDDVVVEYTNNSKKYYQVKHTRVDDTITFSYLVSEDKKGMSLLKSLARAWKEVKNKGQQSIPILYTNRKYGTKTSNVKNKDGEKFIRPLLQDFWKILKEQLYNVQSIEDIKFCDKWKSAWNEWYNQLEELETLEEKMEFSKLLEIRVEQPSLQELEDQLIDKLSEVFGVRREKAISILPSLYYALVDWSTTIRGQQESITVEMVYDKLSISAEGSIGQHRLCTPEPFFPSRKSFVESLAKELLKGPNKILFLSGSPGIGKTSIVNYLANRHDPIIDLRYHAYHPITPSTTTLPSDAGQMTRAEVLWGDLLTQLRSFFKGRLAKNNVPIKNEFLTTDEMREHVLRLANILGEERNRRTIIAIDGIDHAARAEQDNHSFLNSLVPPEGIPEGVCFFIVGQPADDYKKYPFWLRDKEVSNITRWVVNGIQIEDIKEMLKGIDFPTSDIDSSARLINHIAEGNTLSAIFAVHEARKFKDLNLLQKSLQQRQLHIGVSAYYDQIWKSTLFELEKKFPLFGFKVAACLTLPSERIEGKDLKGIFQDIPISSDDWNDILRSLSPLIIEDKGGFRVTHNDVRVYLSKQLKIETRKLREIASTIADYYWNNSSKSNARHQDLFRLLGLSERDLDKAKVFTPEYVIEGIALNRSRDELLDQCKQALLVVSKSKDWDLIHTLSCSISTLSQYFKTMEYTDREYNFSTGVPPVLLSEGHVLNVVNWKVDILKNTIDDSLRLIHLNELNRAKGLLRRWFHDFTPLDLLEVMPEKEKYEERGDKKYLKNSIKEFFKDWGKATQYTGILWSVESLDKESMGKDERHALALFFDGYLAEAKNYEKFNWARKLRTSPILIWSNLESCIDYFAEEMRWEEIAYTLKVVEKRIKKLEKCPSSFRIKAAAYALLTGKKEVYSVWCGLIQEQGYSAIQEDTFNLEKKIYMYCIVSFVKGWLNPQLETGTISDEAVYYYFLNRQDDSKKEHVSVLNNICAILGNCYRTFLTKSPHLVKNVITEKQLERLLQALLKKERSLFKQVYGSHFVTKLILQMIIHLSNTVGNPFNLTLYNYLINYCSNYPVNFMLELGWEYLSDHGEHEFLLNWFHHWNGEEGQVWQEDIASRLDIIDRFIQLAKDTGFEEEVVNLSSKVRWGKISYVNHKEDALEKPLLWLEELSLCNANYWINYGKTLLEVSQEASRLGDNLMGYRITDEVINSAVFSGINHIWKLYNAENLNTSLKENPTALIKAITKMIIKNSNFKDDELLGFWAFGTGVLAWQDTSCHFDIENLKNAVIKKGSHSIYKKMTDIAPAEYYITSTEVTYKGSNLQEYKVDDMMLNHAKEDSLNEAISKVALFSEQHELYSMGTIWKAVQILAKRIQNERPTGFEQKVEKLISLLDNREHTYSWSYDGIGEAYKQIIYLINDERRIGLLDKLIKETDFEGNNRLWLESLGENIELICLYRAIPLGEKAIVKGLQQLLDTQKLWIEGHGHLSNLKEIEFHKNKYNPTSWVEFAAYYLFDLIKTDNGTRVQGALKGLWGIAKFNPSSLSFIDSRFDELHSRAKEWILLLAEYAARTSKTSYLPFRNIVLKCYNSDDIVLKFQAYNVLIALQSTTGEKVPNWSFKTHPFLERISSLKLGTERGLMSIPHLSQGSLYSVQGIQLIESKIQLLEAATYENLEDLEKKFIAYVRESVNESEYQLIKVHKQEGSMRIILSPELNLFKHLIYVELSKGRWLEVPKVRLAQAITTSSDPFVLLKSPSPARGLESWLVDEELKRIIGNNEQLRKHFNYLTNIGISEDEMVLGAVIFSYSREFDVKFIYDTAIRQSTSILEKASLLSTFNGRSSSFYDVNRFDPQEFEEGIFSMTYESGGIGDFVHQSILCYPSNMWTNLFGWYPQRDNPLLWNDNEGNNVAKFEYFHGPIRNLVRDRFERQPFMQRWVVKKEAFEEALKKYSGNLMYSPRSNVKVYQLPES